MPTRTRLVSLADAAELSAVLRENRDFLRPYEPTRSPAYFLEEGQAAAIELALERHARGLALPLVIQDDQGSIVGRLNLREITRGPSEAAVLGYWVAESHNRRGLATQAVAAVAGEAFSGLALHRLRAATLVHNIAAQRVLHKSGFQAVGFAQKYLRINGMWQDHILYQLLAPGAD